MTTLFVCSDLHNERLPFAIPHDTPRVDVLVAAGDVDDIPERAIEYLNSFGCPVVYVLGNHDLWSHVKHYQDPREDFMVRLNRMRAMCAGTNVHLLENDSVVIDGMRFLGATLWTSYLNGNPQLMRYALNAMSDYGCIGAHEYLRDPDNRAQYIEDRRTYGFPDVSASFDWDTARFHPVIARRLHEQSCRWLTQELMQPQGDWERTVVVTHHAPTFLSLTSTHAIAERALDPRNWARQLDMRWDNDRIYRVAAYASDVSCISIKRDVIDLCIHGHLHKSVDVAYCGVRVIANPRGYSYGDYQMGDNRDFDPRLVIDLETQPGYMSALTKEINDVLPKLEFLLDELKDLGQHLRHKDPVIRESIEESYVARASAFRNEGARLCARINSNIGNSMRNEETLDFPIKGFQVSSDLDIQIRGHNFDVRLRAPSVVIKKGRRFIDALKRVDQIPSLMAKEAARKAKLVLEVLKENGLQGEYWASGSRHADRDIRVSVCGEADDERRMELEQRCDKAVNPGNSRDWLVSLSWGADLDMGAMEPMLREYAAGNISRREIEDEFDMSFWEILAGLRALGLQLPRHNMGERYSKAQKDLAKEFFARASGTRK